MEHPGMHQTRERSHFGWGWLILGILFVVAAVLSFVNPAGNLEAIAFTFGFLAIITGVWAIVNNYGSALRIVGGVLDLLIGVFFIANVWMAVAALPYIFAIWFIVDSVFRLINIGYTRILGSGYFVLSLILNIIGVILGVMLLFNPVVAALTLSLMVGFYLMLAGIEFIALAFATR